MKLGLGLSLCEAALARRAFSPASLNPVIWLDFSDLSTLFQERTGAAATTQATIDGVVGTVRSKGNGGVNYFVAPTDAARGILRLVNGKYSVQSDGVDDAYFCSDAFPATTYVAGAVQSTNTTWTTARYNAFLDARAATANRMGLLVKPGNTGLFEVPFPSSTRQNGTSIAPSNSCWTNISTAFIFDIVTTAGKDGVGFGRNLGQYDTGLGAMAASKLYQIVALAQPPSTSNRLQLEIWLAAKSGVTL